ncbi:hypothetical protein A3C87_00715 [Candidatus Kaiserbacteria bacterium RIFCSPHIGHO2_02_FULL_49_34]|uniref:Bacterial type II secretion system protein E domain-containing protein n=1 Tax=Candidatus Kaiserbacteria bacterium RIFCSPHIGHO2_02_FULL_49_34 TaxID=1798491 RepID=A0A1F6DKH3_9BACT|nr:MAG: hypothetical protein A3C87_00715 [Candidatus Kaiserbacteria bacterium RIFCSPHIGHO2_02_FULL_49_34]
MHLSQETFDSLFIASGLVTKDDLSLARDEAKKQGKSPFDTLISLGKISEAHLAEVLATYYEVPIFDAKRSETEDDALMRLPQAFIKTHRVFITAEDDTTVTLGMVDPGDADTIAEVRAMTGKWVNAAVVTMSSVAYALKKYRAAQGVVFDAHRAAVEAQDGESASIIETLDALLEHAITLGASDLHVEPLENMLVVRARIDGIMQEIASFPKSFSAPLVARIKVIANLQVDEHNAPQDGRFRANADAAGTIDIRVNIMPVLHGEKAEMRLLRSTSRPITFRDIGLAPVQEALLEAEVHKPHGMILVTGPTGHGKTTTLYAILHKLNSPKVNITTIEDPIEYEFPHVNQTQVNARAGITFANGLRSLLRQNPDIIMVGEIRDEETADIAVHAALTGHLVLSSLHTNDAPSALPRLVDMGVEPFLLASTINAVVAQRLVRKICPTCIYSYKISPEIKRAITAQKKALGDTHIKTVPETLYRGKGCSVCGGSGFLGQVAVFEIMAMNDELRELAQKQTGAAVIRKQAIKGGMTTMFEDGLQKVERGVTTIEEVLRVVQE